MNKRTLVTLALAAILAGTGAAPGQAQSGFDGASEGLQAQLDESLAELSALREALAAEKIPLSRQLSELEAELTQVQEEYLRTTRTLDSRTLDLGNLRNEIESRQDEMSYLGSLLSDYMRKFESSLHIAELARYAEPLESARLEAENSDLAGDDPYVAQVGLVGTSIDRIESALGGDRFLGTAVDADGLVLNGTFLMMGPAALFVSSSGAVGTAEQRLGSLEPTQLAFATPENTDAASALVEEGNGFFPLDPTLGNAHKMAATEETLLEHIQKGGVVMIPIFTMAGFALLVALYKWLALLFQRKPSKKSVARLLEAVSRQDQDAAAEAVRYVKGPAGRMLQAGVEHMNEPRELIEEVMYETVLTTRLKLQSLLPFIAICAASAPLLGLLGTVTGIISTFKLITVFGSGDVKTLSGGISEALITTEFGLIVAIPSLLLHAFLSRKARSIVSHMETSAVAFANEVSRSLPTARIQPTAPATLGAPAASGVASMPVVPVAAPASSPDVLQAQIAAMVREQVDRELAKAQAGAE